SLRSLATLLGLALFVGLAAAGCDGAPPVDESLIEKTEKALSDNACHYRCQACPAHQVCALVCFASGNCGSQCVETMLCIIGYHFDSTACRCVPDAGTACGPSICPAGQVCCNASCGICTEPGGFCTQ